MKFMYPQKPNRITIDSPLFLSKSTDDNYVLQIKKNGWRIQIHKNGDDVRFFSRHNKDMESIVQDADWNLMRERIRALDCESCIIDGEFMHRRGKKKNFLYVWDIFYANGELLKVRYGMRKGVLNSLIDSDDVLEVAKDYKTDWFQFWEELEDPEENEGIVIKSLNEKLKIVYGKKTGELKSSVQFKILLDDKRNSA